ncbi:hypothetical protein P308_00195 [Pseudomonas piscis]|nr:hypothetical protein P308_00195 [Pseudomonas piscis]
MQGFEDLLGSVMGQAGIDGRVVENGEIAHQDQPLDLGCLQACNQRIGRLHLGQRIGDPARHRTARQAGSIQQADHRRAAGHALLHPVGIEQVAALGAQARARGQGGEIVENGDDFVLAPQAFRHQRTAQAARGTIERQLDHWGFGIFHGRASSCFLQVGL